MGLICDTGVLYAAAVRRDRNHDRCVQLLENWPDPLVTPAPVIVELDWLAHSRRAPAVTDGVLRAIETGGLYVEELTLEDYSRIRELTRRYSDLPLGLVDSSVIAVAERLGERTIATLDQRHLGVVKPRHARSLTLLPN